MPYGAFTPWLTCVLLQNSSEFATLDQAFDCVVATFCHHGPPLFSRGAHFRLQAPLYAVVKRWPRDDETRCARQ